MRRPQSGLISGTDLQVFRFLDPRIGKFSTQDSFFVPTPALPSIHIFLFLRLFLSLFLFRSPELCLQFRREFPGLCPYRWIAGRLRVIGLYFVSLLALGSASMSDKVGGFLGRIAGSSPLVRCVEEAFADLMSCRDHARHSPCPWRRDHSNRLGCCAGSAAQPAV